jgi:MFS transporter, DHA2 family, multidrug resistance protein
MVSPGTVASTLVDAPRRRLITTFLMMASFMQVLDTTIANVALPHIQGSLSATQDQMSWVLTSYIVVSAIMTPLTGWLAGRFGRRRVFLISIATFTIASILCGISQTLTQIIVSRVAQGMGGAALVPLAQAVMLDINPPERHAKAMSTWVMGVTLGPIVGPALGGFLTENYDWRWVFYINVPVGVLALLGLLSTMPETDKRRSSFDFFGFATLSLAVGALQIFLDRGQLKDWFGSPEICIEAAVAVIAFYLFIVHMITGRGTRFVSPGLFKDSNFIVGSLFVFTIGLVLYASLALLPPLLQGLMNYPVITTGLVTAPRGLGSLMSAVIIGRISNKVDARLIIASGFALTALSAWQMSHFDLQMDSSTVMWSGIAQGLGTALAYVPMASAAFATLDPALRNEGASFFSLQRNLGSSIGISVAQTLLTRNTQVMHSSLATHVTAFTPLIRAQTHGDGLTAMQLANLNSQVTVQGAMVAYVDDFHLMMWLALGSIPLVLLLRKARQTR